MTNKLICSKCVLLKIRKNIKMLSICQNKNLVGSKIFSLLKVSIT